MTLIQKGTPITIESAGYNYGGLDPDITVLANGNMVVVWAENIGQPTDMFDDTDGAVFARVLDSNGVPLGDVFQVNESQANLQNKPEVVALASGGFAVGWTNISQFGDHPSDTDTFVRFFDNSGTAIPDFMIDVVQDTPGWPLGSPQDSPIEPDAAKQVLHEMVALSGNRFAVLLEGDIAGSTQDSGAHVYNSSGTKVAILDYDVDDMVQLANGNIVTATTMIENSHANPSEAIRLTLMDDRFDGPDGIAGVYDPLTFYIDGSLDKEKDQNNLELAALGGGGFALAFVEGVADSGSTIRLELMSGEALKEFSTSPVSRSLSFDSPNGQFDMISLSGGGLAMAVVTEDVADTTYGVDVLMFDENGAQQGVAIHVGAGGALRQSPTLTELPDGTVALAYTDSTANDGNPLKLVLFDVADPRQNLTGTAGDDDLSGLGGNDRISGLGGDDTIVGLGGNDVLKGGDGADDLDGGDGKDSLRGGDGDDRLVGGTGADGLGGGNGNDILSGQNGRDIMGGGQGDDRLFGGRGNDVLKGGSGSDTMSGGAGADTFVFVNGQAGADVITDFDETLDTIRLDLRGADQALLSVSAAAGDTLITLDTLDITLSGVELTESDITFLFL